MKHHHSDAQAQLQLYFLNSLLGEIKTQQTPKHAAGHRVTSVAPDTPPPSIGQKGDDVIFVISSQNAHLRQTLSDLLYILSYLVISSIS